MSFIDAMKTLDRIGKMLGKYSDDQPRDESGRWTSGGGSGGGSGNAGSHSISSGTLTDSRGRTQQYSIGHASVVRLPKDQDISIAYHPETRSLGYATGAAGDDVLAGKMPGGLTVTGFITAPAGQSERTIYVSAPMGPSSSETQRTDAVRGVNATLSVLRDQGFPLGMRTLITSRYVGGSEQATLNEDYDPFRGLPRR